MLYEVITKKGEDDIFSLFLSNSNVITSYSIHYTKLYDLIRSNAVDVIVIDSVAALVPRAEIDGNVGDQHVGLQARLMSHALRKFTGILKRSIV